MVLTPHLLVGAAIASKVESAPLAIFISFLSHFFLDVLPHKDYCIDKIKEKKWRESLPVFLGIAADMSLGLLIIFLLSENTLVIYAAALAGIATDGATFIGIVLPNKLFNYYSALHIKFHYLESKEPPVISGVATQLLAVLVSSIFLL